MQKSTLPSLGLKGVGMVIGALILLAFMWAISL